MLPSWLQRLVRRSLRPARRTRPQVETLEDRVVPSTLELQNNALQFTAGAGEANNLTISVAAGTYTFHDTGAAIILGPAALGAGWAGNGTNTVTGPEKSIGSAGIALNLGDQANTVTVQSIDNPLSIGDSSGGTDAVTVGGAANGVQGVNAAVTVMGPGDHPASVSLVLDDRGNATPRTATLAGTFTSGVGFEGQVSGLAPGTVSYLVGKVGSLAIDGGSGGNTFTVVDTVVNTTLLAGTGNDTVLVQGSTRPLTVDPQAGTNAVTLGNAGNLTPLFGVVVVATSGGGNTTLTVDDSADAASRNLSVSTAAVLGLPLKGIAYSNLAQLDVLLGPGSNTVDVSSFAGSGSLSGAGGNTVTAASNANFTLTDTQLVRTGGGSSMTLALSGFTGARLTGGVGDNVLDASTFTGSVTLQGGAGDDTLYGGLGDDSLDGGSGDNLEVGGMGNDTLTCGTGDSTLYGGSGNDVLRGGPGNDSLLGGSGNDTLTGGGGTNFLDGGSGTNEVLESADTSFTLTSSLLNGGAALTDTLTNIQAASLSVPASSMFHHKLNASAFPGNVTLIGGAGGDTLRAGAGDDSLVGGPGNDVLVGGAGNDTLSAGLGTNVVAGGAGTNTLQEAQDSGFTLTNTALTGSKLNDTLSNIQVAQLVDTNTSGKGRTLDASGFTGSVTLVGGAGNDTLAGSAGTSLLDGGGGANVVRAAGAVDFTLTNTSLAGQGLASLINLQQARLTIAAGNHRIDATGFSGHATLQGGPGDDTLIAGPGGDVLRGGDGNNILLGGSGNDTLAGGGSGRNLLIGGDGINSLVGGTGDDILIAQRTTFTNPPTGGINFAALNAIMAEWTSTDSYSLRIARLSGAKPGGKNGGSLLNGTTVSSTTSLLMDSLTGGLGSDWFFVSPTDKITDLAGSEKRVIV
jgi:Ca2+-binding RTX toxin-like protein